MQSPSPHNKNQMHPQDMRNLMIFAVLSLVLYLAYEHFILQPQVEALRQVQIQAAQKQAQTPSIDGQETDIAQKPLERSQALALSERIPFENAELKGSISLKGGRINDAALKNYFETLDKEENVVLLSPAKTAFPRYIETGWVADRDAVNLPDNETVWQVQGNDRLGPGNLVTLYWDNGQGLRFEREYRIDKNFLITVTERISNGGPETVSLFPYGLISQRGLPPEFYNNWLIHEGPIGWFQQSLSEVSYKNLREEGTKRFQSKGGWTGITEKYWLLGLVPSQNEITKYRFQFTPQANDGVEGRYQVDFVGAMHEIPAGGSAEYTSHAFIGAKKVIELTEYGEQLNAENFDLAVNFGWFWFLSKPFFYALHYLGEFTGNLGWAIILLTILIRSAVFPLTNASYRSFAKMKKVTPQVMELRESYGEDKAKLQQELVKLYQREGVNPMAGCFPILLQIPIFFALYKVLFVTIEVRHAPFIGWIQDLSAPDPTSIFNLFGLIPWEPPSLLQIGVWPCIMLVALIIQKKLNPPPQDPIQRDLANYFPFIITFVMSRFAAGLVIYWTFSAIIGVIQQIIIMRMLNVPIHLFGQTEDEKKMEEAVEKGPGVHPLAEMAEDEVEEAMFGKDEEQSSRDIKPPKPKKKKKKK